MLSFVQKLKLCRRILLAPAGNTLRHAERELAASRATGDEMNIAMADGLEELVLVFSTQGHSGFSAAYARAALDKLLDFKPLGPLTGADDEWVAIGDGCFQNRRDSSVFKNAAGAAYTIDGYVFREPEGACFTGRGSRKYISFPYTPTDPIIVDVNAEGEPLDPQYAGLRN